MSDTLPTLGYVAGALVSLGIIWRYVIAPVSRAIVGLHRFLDDWTGQPPRPGYPPVPGVMEQLATVRNEVTYNGGGSIKDAVRRIESTQKSTSDLLALHLARFDQHLADSQHIIVQPADPPEAS